MAGKARAPDLSVVKERWEMRAEPQQQGQSLRQFVGKRMPWLDGAAVERLFLAGNVSVGAAAAAPGDVVQNQQVVEVRMAAPPDLPDPRRIPIAVLHDDGAMLVLNKQAGLPVQPRGPGEGLRSGAPSPASEGPVPGSRTGLLPPNGGRCEGPCIA